MWRVREQMVKSVVVRVDVDEATADDVEALATLCDAHRGTCKLYFELASAELPRPVRLRARTADEGLIVVSIARARIVVASRKRPGRVK